MRIEIRTQPHLHYWKGEKLTLCKREVREYFPDLNEDNVATAVFSQTKAYDAVWLDKEEETYIDVDGRTIYVMQDFWDLIPEEGTWFWIERQ